MNRVINVGNKKQARKELEQFKSKHYDAIDLRLENVHLLSLNELVGHQLFRKSSLFVRSSTLWEIMQPVGKVGKHHYHGLDAEEIIEVLSSLYKSVLIYKSYSNRYAVFVSGKKKKRVLVVVIELNAGLENDRNADINKLVTIYPKENYDEFIKHLDKKEVIYKK